MKLPLFELVSQMLSRKATWKMLAPKTRKLSARLLVCGIYCLIASMMCVAAVSYQAPNVEMFQYLGFLSVIAWVTLTFLALTFNVAGVTISRAERYRRLNPAVQKCAKGILVARMPALCVASYRAGNARACRSPSRSHASKDNSGDGEPGSGEGDPPALPVFSSLSSRPRLTFILLFCKLNSFPFPWRFLLCPGCWRMVFSFSLTGRRWEK